MKKLYLLGVVLAAAALVTGCLGVNTAGTESSDQRIGGPATTITPTSTAPAAILSPTVIPLAPTPTSVFSVVTVAAPEATSTSRLAPTDTPAPAAANLPPELEALPVDDAPQLWDTASQSWDYVFRSAVSEPGQAARYQVNLVGAFRDATVLKMSVDDMLVAAYIVDVAGARTDISSAFDIGAIPTGEAALDAVLADRFLNVEEGEILPHLKKAIWLGNLPAGTKIEFFVKDDASLQVNRGLGLVMYFNTSPQDLPGGSLYIVDTAGNPVP